MNMNKKIIIISLIIVSGACLWLSVKGVLLYQVRAAESAVLEVQSQAIEDLIDSRRMENSEESAADPFSENDVVNILFIGLDTRAGQENGHCDAIQLISINKTGAGSITITAVPRGTYSPLPPGKGASSTDYYVSNACGLVGLGYGVQQIENILGVKSDYLVVVGFSETMGILRYLRLPTIETLQWLRNRHGYEIGEPQRARNHSTFIKQMIVKFTPSNQSKLDTVLNYIVYQLVKTDLSFAQTQKIIKALSAMGVANHPEKIHLDMRPAYDTRDIAYDSENISEHLDRTLNPIKRLLSKDDYSEITEETSQANLLETIDKNKNKPEFVAWAYKNNLWLQVDDDLKRLAVQYDLLSRYLSLLSDKKEREAVLVNYILEMEIQNDILWMEKAKDDLAREMGY